MVRFKVISSIPATMQTYDYEPPCKHFDESIVDRSCFSPLSEQLKTLQPMTPLERDQHFDFPDGKDDGRKAPRPRGADLAEISSDIHQKQEKIKFELKKAEEKLQREMKNQALAEANKAKDVIKE